MRRLFIICFIVYASLRLIRFISNVEESFSVIDYIGYAELTDVITTVLMLVKSFLGNLYPPHVVKSLIDCNKKRKE